MPPARPLVRWAGISRNSVCRRLESSVGLAAGAVSPAAVRLEVGIEAGAVRALLDGSLFLGDVLAQLSVRGEQAAVGYGET